MTSLRLLAFISLAAAVCPGSLAVECPANYVSIDGECFLFADNVASPWADAEALCVQQGGSLAKLNQCTLFASVVKYMEANNLIQPNGYWLGADDFIHEDSWVWLDGTPMARGAPFWGKANPGAAKSEPHSEVEDCAMIQSDGFYFHDYFCDDFAGMYFICQIAPDAVGACQSPYVAIGNACLQFVRLEEDWNTSRRICNVGGGDLAVIDDCNLLGLVKDYVIKNENGTLPTTGYWIGGSDKALEGDWKWITGAPMELGVPFWGIDHIGALAPDNQGTGENCLRMNPNARHYFDDFDCSSDVGISPLCQAPPLA